MGQSKGGGYTKKDTLLPEQMSLLQSILSGNNQASQGFSQFLPGGGGGEAIKAQALKDYQQQTIPSITNALGTDSKSSSTLNQALASSGADLNTNLASMLSQLQLGAAQGLGNLQQGALGTPGFAYMQRQPPIWQQILQSALGAGGQIAGSWASGGFQNPFGGQKSNMQFPTG